MRILFTRFPLESAYGGAEVQTLSLMKGLRKRGHDVMFLGSCPTLLRAISDQRLAISARKLNIGDPPVTKWGAVSFLWRKRRMKRKLITTLKVEGYPSERHGRAGRLKDKEKQHSTFNLQLSTFNLDAIFMLSLSEKLLLTDWCVENGIKVFWIEHDRVGWWLTHNPWLPRLRKLSEKVTTVVVSDLSRDIYLKLGWKQERVVSIPNGVDVEKFTGGTRVPRVLHGSESRAIFRLGCIARLTPDKGIDLLIEAVAALPNITLDIVGTGREEKHIRQLAQRVNKLTSKRVNVLPATDPLHFYRTIDCLVLPSRKHDPFGLVVAEAMATGVPTIVTDACGIARHLEEDEAIIVPAGKVQALRSALVEIQKEEKWLALAKKGPCVAREKFSDTQMITRYEELLRL